MVTTATSTLAMAISILEVLPSVLEAGSAAEQLVVSGLANIRAMEAQGRNPSPTEWAAIEAQIATLSGELDVPEGEDPNDLSGATDLDGNPVKTTDVFVDAPEGTGPDGLVAGSTPGTVQTAAVPLDDDGKPVAETLETAAPPPAPADAPIVTPGSQGLAETPMDARVTSDLPAVTSATTTPVAAQAGQAKADADLPVAPGTGEVAQTAPTGSEAEEARARKALMDD